MNPLVADDDDEDMEPPGMKASCSAFVALRMWMVFPISVMVEDT